MPRTPRKIAMAENAIEMLKVDQQHVKELFKKYQAAGERASKNKQKIAEEVCRELEVHAQLEEEIFYPAVEAEEDKEGKKLIAESVEEHHIVKTLIKELRELTPEDKQYDAKFTVLMENVKHHVDEEEEELFAEAEELLGPEIESLGMQMQERKQQLIEALS